MDLTTTPTPTPKSSPTTTPDTDNDTPPHTHQQQVKHFSSSSYANGAVKKHHFPCHLHHYLHHHQFLEGVNGGNNININNSNVNITYRECLKNHAASIGGHALDGCGEFMASSTTVDPTDPTSLKCAACGCHRNFHRREPDHHDHHYFSSTSPMIIPHFLDFRHPPPPVLGRTTTTTTTTATMSSPSPSPPPPSHPTQSFPPGQMLLALSSAAHDDDHHHHHHQIGGLGGGGGLNQNQNQNHHHRHNHHHYHQQVATPVTPTAVKSENLIGRKRFRTKFTQEQKEKMHLFSEKLGWKLQKCDDAMVKDFCNEIGVARGVLKVWMHNNKNTLGKKEISTAPITTTTTTTTPTTINNNEAEDQNNIITNASINYHIETRDAAHVHHLHTSTNGSSSSS